MVVSCSPESLTMCYVDWNRELWEKLWQHALHIFDIQDASIPGELHPQTQELRTVLKDFVHTNSVITVEVPTLECIDMKAYEPSESDHSQFYWHRDAYPHLNVDEDEVCQHVLNCCKSTMCAVTKAHDLERRKATEVLLFLLTDTDHSYNKDKPSSIPVAYALKGRSLKTETTRQMVMDVRNFLHQHKINVLVEAYDGQWSSLVFLDHNDKPLTLFELQRDCWLKFKTMSQEKLINFIESLSKNTDLNLDEWSSTLMNPPESKCIGNIRVHLKWHSKQTRDPQHMQHCKSFIEVHSYCNKNNCEDGLAVVTWCMAGTPIWAKFVAPT